MKALLLALALFGDTPWQENGTEMYAGLTCATRREAEVIASNPLRYTFADTVSQRTRCLFMAFNGRKVGETDAFNIGDHIFSFQLIEAEGYTFYVLEDEGEGWVA